MWSRTPREVVVVYDVVVVVYDVVCMLLLYIHTYDVVGHLLSVGRLYEFPAECISMCVVGSTICMLAFVRCTVRPVYGVHVVPFVRCTVYRSYMLYRSSGVWGRESPQKILDFCVDCVRARRREFGFCFCGGEMMV